MEATSAMRHSKSPAGRRSTSRLATRPGSMRGSWCVGHGLLVGEKSVHQYARPCGSRRERSRVRTWRGYVGVGDLLPLLMSARARLAAGLGRTEPIGIERHDEHARLDPPAGFGQIAAAPNRGIIVVHGARDDRGSYWRRSVRQSCGPGGPGSSPPRTRIPKPVVGHRRSRPATGGRTSRCMPSSER